jgi:hypothetical protein
MNSMVPDDWLVHAGENLDQRRFAGTVVAHQGHDFAGMTSRSMSVRAETAPKFLEILLSRRMVSALLRHRTRVAHHGSGPFWEWSSPDRHKRPGEFGRTLLDAELLAAVGIFAGANLCRRLDLLVEDLGLDVLGGDDGRHEELRWRVVELVLRLGRLALDQLERDLGGSGSDDFRSAWRSCCTDRRR